MTKLRAFVGALVVAGCLVGVPQTAYAVECNSLEYYFILNYMNSMTPSQANLDLVLHTFEHNCSYLQVSEGYDAYVAWTWTLPPPGLFTIWEWWGFWMEWFGQQM